MGWPFPGSETAADNRCRSHGQPRNQAEYHLNVTPGGGSEGEKAAIPSPSTHRQTESQGTSALIPTPSQIATSTPLPAADPTATPAPAPRRLTPHPPDHQTCGTPWRDRRYGSVGMLWRERTTTTSTTTTFSTPVVRCVQTAARVSAKSWQPMLLVPLTSIPTPMQAKLLLGGCLQPGGMLGD